MTTKRYLSLRGAFHLLLHSVEWIERYPWEPDWAVPEMDKYGHAKSVDDALQILRTARRAVEQEFRGAKDD